MSRFPIANKQFGQHFLHSKNVISKITSPLPEETDCIVEIGPGPAVLTPHLKSYELPLFVIEMDERFVEILSPIVGIDSVYRQDALDFNWNEFLNQHSFLHIWLVSNLPYNVSVPLTLSFLKIKEIESMTLMYQKEVAEKILPKKLHNSMNSLHALCYSQFDIKHVVYAPPGAFMPPPKVDSQVLSFKRRKTPLVKLEQIKEFETFLRITFSQKRKQLGGLLKGSYGAEKSTYMLSKAQIAPNVRAESLNFEQVLALFEACLL